jgi:hypothetical protein
MGKLILDVPGLEGEYEADLTYFTNRELHEVKKQTGLRAGEFEEAFAKGDNDVMVAFASIILERAGKPGAAELLWDARAGSITFDFTEDEQAADEDPPQATPPGAAESESGTVDGNGSSGEASRLSSDRPASDLSPTGFSV